MQELYLDLLGRAVTGNLFGVEPDPDDADTLRFKKGFIEHYIRGTAHTMVPLGRLDNVRACVVDVVEKGVPGDLLEAGVWRGGTTIFMRGILKALGVTDRRVWVADSFQGLPEPDAARFPKEARAFRNKTMIEEYKRFAVTADEVRGNFARYGLLDEQVRFLEGWFADTLPRAPIERLAVLRLDGDYHASTRDALTHLYPKLSPGGYLIIDDYGEDEWTHCRDAVEEYRGEHGITEAIVRVDSRCHYWQRAMP